MSVSIVFARGIISEIQDRGLDGQELLRRSGIDASRIGDIRESLQPDESERLMLHAVAMTDDPALGLAVGARDPGSQFQLFAHLLRAQPTIRDAISMHMRFSGLIARGPRWSLLERGDLAYFTLTPALRHGRLRRFMMEYGITASTRMCSSFLPRLSPPRTTRLHEVHFNHAAPGYADKYRSFFSCPVLFGQPTNSILFPRALLDHRQVHADATISRVLEESAERLLQMQVQEGLLHRRIRLLLRYCLDLPSVSAERIARDMGLSLRTLRRRLAREGVSLSELLDEARCRVACEALRRQSVSMAEVAEQTGFAEASAFFRAFKRWTGQTPGDYRRRVLATSGSNDLPSDDDDPR